MPGFFAHYLCGQKTLESINKSPLKSIVSKHMQLFNIGTQGPDIFFYYGFWPWVDSSEMNEVGEIIHSHKVRDFFSNVLKYITDREASEQEALIAYLCGYVCHYALDTNAHPYVFYKTGFIREGEDNTSKYTYYHRLLETTIDFILVTEILKCRPSDINAKTLIKPSIEDFGHLCLMLSKVLKNSHDIDINAGKIQSAITDMGNALSVLRDRTGLKKKILSAVEAGIGRYPLMSSMIYPTVLTDNLDYMNLQKSSWSLPWDEEAVRNSSFYEMFDDAVSEAAQMSEVIYNCITGALSTESALTILGNRSFSSGMDSSIDLKFRYYDCIFE